MDTTLINKYNIPGPRYTSYPTVPYWNKKGIKYKTWTESVKKSFLESNEREGISIYIHLPFCESLCTFCACHKRITKQHSVEYPYIETLLKEWHLYLKLFEEKPVLKEIHLGGGTPTFFQVKNLTQLIESILSTCILHEEHEFSFEGHPNNTTREHLQVLYDLGFRRNSFGVQDYDERVQKTINRIQPFENVKRVTDWSREIGYQSVSHDLIFGLPHQSLKSIENTIKKTKELKPDRIAFYSYAHVPWIKNVGQRGFSEDDLPTADEKRILYEAGKKWLYELDYTEIGMDHFALKEDSLFQAFQEKKLHRNFMGYTASKTQLMVGLGMSSISDSWFAFAQNIKTLKEYTARVDEGFIPIFRGHELSQKDLVIRKHILNIMCHFKTSWSNDSMKFSELGKTLSLLREMENDGLVNIYHDGLQVPEEARQYVRNICMAFDLHLINHKPETRIFSMTI